MFFTRATTPALFNSDNFHERFIGMTRHDLHKYYLSMLSARKGVFLSGKTVVICCKRTKHHTNDIPLESSWNGEFDSGRTAASSPVLGENGTNVRRNLVLRTVLWWGQNSKKYGSLPMSCTRASTTRNAVRYRVPNICLSRLSLSPRGLNLSIACDISNICNLIPLILWELYDHDCLQSTIDASENVVSCCKPFDEVQVKRRMGKRFVLMVLMVWRRHLGV
jgi:hypothetical protein